MNSIESLLQEHLDEPRSSWSVGTFGAIGEFHREAGETVRREGLLVRTGRGALSITPLATMRTIAWERLGSHGESWTSGVAFCLPVGDAVTSARTTVTEIGPDHGALRAEDRGALLFDLGAGALHCDVCVRTNDRAQIALLQSYCGTSVLDPGNSLFGELLAMRPSPHRVFRSRLARLEVYQAIPAPGGETPRGPHTHILLALLRNRRTHPATTPLPEGWVPALELYPASAIQDDFGRAIPFDAKAHAAFQSLFERFAEPDVLSLKRQVMQAVREGRAPAEAGAVTRAQRVVRRVALRQMVYTDGMSPTLAAWLDYFDHGKVVQAA